MKPNLIFWFIQLIGSSSFRGQKNDEDINDGHNQYDRQYGPVYLRANEIIAEYFWSL